MKTTMNLRKYVLVVVCVFVVASCEKSEVETEVTTVEHQEGFISTTGNSDTSIEQNPSEMVQPLFQMHFDAEVSEEDALAIFNKKAADFMKTYKSQVKGVSTKWHYRICTYTGNQLNANTNGMVQAWVDFNTDKGGSHTSALNLDNPGDDREGGMGLLYL